MPKHQTFKQEAPISEKGTTNSHQITNQAHPKQLTLILHRFQFQTNDPAKPQQHLPWPSRCSSWYIWNNNSQSLIEYGKIDYICRDSSNFLIFLHTRLVKYVNWEMSSTNTGGQPKTKAVFSRSQWNKHKQYLKLIRLGISTLSILWNFKLYNLNKRKSRKESLQSSIQEA